MLVLQIFVMRNGAFEGTEMVQGDRIDIGRDPQSALCLDDDSCSSVTRASLSGSVSRMASPARLR